MTGAMSVYVVHWVAAWKSAGLWLLTLRVEVGRGSGYTRFERRIAGDGDSVAE